MPGCTYYFNPYLVHPSWADSMHFVKHYGSDATSSADFYEP